MPLLQLCCLLQVWKGVDREETVSLLDLREAVYVWLKKTRNQSKTELPEMWTANAHLQKRSRNSSAKMLRLPDLQNI